VRARSVWNRSGTAARIRNHSGIVPYACIEHRAKLERAPLGNLPDPINDIARFGYLTGWQKRRRLGEAVAPRDRAGERHDEMAAIESAGQRIGDDLRFERPNARA
jgi:hypothetical protein